MELGPHQLPGIWRYLLPADAAWLALPAERRATCDDCYWVRKGRCHDECRCCTYLPQLPNFFVGLALKDPACREAMVALIEVGAMLPVGLLASPQQFARAVASRAEDRFGEDPSQLCPFFERESRRCAIYTYRNSVCSTFFCVHDHGESGAEFWGALQALAGNAETALGQWAMGVVGLPSASHARTLDRLSGEIEALSATQGWSELARRALWGQWYGREVAFFERCAEAVVARLDDLYAIACEQPLLPALRYERALVAWLPPSLRSEAPEPPEGEAVPIPQLWYRLQLKARQLWALPFGEEGAVQLAEGLHLVANPGFEAGPLATEQAFLIRASDGQALHTCSLAQANALELFRQPQTLGEALMACPEIVALDQPRIYLAEWMRRGLLVGKPRD